MIIRLVIFNAEVVCNESKGDVLFGVNPKTWSISNWFIAIGLGMCFDLIMG